MKLSTLIIWSGNKYKDIKKSSEPRVLEKEAGYFFFKVGLINQAPTVRKKKPVALFSEI